METSNFILEKDFAEQGYTFIIGTDEVGRGPLCGPVLACAAMYKDPNFEIPENLQKQFDLIRDSKKLSEKQREEIFDFIHENFYVGIGLCDHETIDRINILEASFLSMKKAIQSLKRNMERETWSLKRVTQNVELETQNAEPGARSVENQNGLQDPRSMLCDTRYMILVDGNKIIPNLSMEQYAVIGGDKICKSISAASIVAKVTRDRMMEEFAKQYPEYGLEKHKGYGTKVHMEALAKYGPCPIHRKSFAPVKKCLK